MKSTHFHALLKAVVKDDQEKINSVILQTIASEKAAGHLTSEATLTKLHQQYKNNFNTNTLIEPCINNKKQTLKEIINRKKANDFLSFICLQEINPIFPSNIEEKLQTIEKEYQEKEQLLKYGLKPIAKILLYGPSGCGKTSGARRIAKNLNLPLIKIDLDGLIDSHLGQTAKNLRQVFQVIEEVECVLLIDECDSLMSHRNNHKDIGEVSRIVNSLLMMLDEDSFKGIIVCTTNLSNCLDTAIWRRFDETIYIPPPTEEQIELIILQVFQKIKFNIKNWEKIYQIFEGYSAAEITKICQNIAKKNILRGKLCVDLEDFLNTSIPCSKLVEQNKKLFLTNN